MYKELNISETEGVLAAFNAVCDLKEETERLQAACAAREAELAALRGQTAELFGARLAAEGADEDSVTAAMAMWQTDSHSAAMAVLGCDIAEAANPWGCNQYGHRKGHSGGDGGSDAKNSEARSSLSDSDADFLTSDAYEIAMEEGGYEILYDTPKEKVKKAIRDTLKETGSASMLEEDTSALYSWWKKNKEKVVNKLKSESLQASNKHACERESEQYSAEYYDALECSHTLEELLEDEEVAAANPYGCNQYGHEWRGKHGENWKPSGRRGGGATAKKEENTAKNRALSYTPSSNKEVHTDNPDYKPEVNKYLRSLKTIIQQESQVHDAIMKGELTPQELKTKLREWKKLQQKYYEELDAFKKKGVGVNKIEQSEVDKIEINTEDELMNHFEDITKRYPEAAK